MRKIIIIAAATLLTGCSTSGTITQRAVEFNRAIVEANNKLLLLNILRASGRTSKGYTEIDSASLDIDPSYGSGNFSVPFGGDATSAFSVAPFFNGPNGSSTTLSSNQNKEFYSGILSPITPETINYYFSQGWDKTLIMMLLIRSIRVSSHTADGKKEENLSQSIEAANVDGDESLKSSCSQPESERYKIEQKEDKLSLLTSYLKSQELGNGGLTSKKLDLLFINDPENENDILNFRALLNLLNPSTFEISTPTLDVEEGQDDVVKILFYLGEIVNAYRGWASTETSESEEFSGNFCSGNSRALCVGKTDKLQPIFLTLEHDQLTRHFLSRKITNKQGATGVEFNGKYRYVPKKDKCGDRTSEGSCIKTRSMQVLSLLTQLFGLNNNSPNLPAARLIDVRGI